MTVYEHHFPCGTQAIFFFRKVQKRAGHFEKKPLRKKKKVVNTVILYEQFCRDLVLAPPLVHDEPDRFRTGDPYTSGHPAVHTFRHRATPSAYHSFPNYLKHVDCYHCLAHYGGCDHSVAHQLHLPSPPPGSLHLGVGPLGAGEDVPPAIA